MRIIKFAAVMARLALGSAAQASDQSAADVLSDQAIILFNGDETDLSGEDYEVFNSMDENALEPQDAEALAIRNMRVRCRSRGLGFRATTCNLRIGPRGRITHVRLIRRLSFFPCVAGRSFGATRRAVWVRQGCSADFMVRYNDGRGFRRGRL